MPTYVYRCDACSHQFELFQRMSDDPIDSCPECRSAVRRVIHPVGVVFKGSGWYVNDSRPKSDTNGSSSSSEASGESSKDGEKGKTETKAKPSKSEKSAPAKTAAD